jgi:GntR family transcriptional regulator
MNNCPRPRTRPAAAQAPASHEDGTMNETTAGRRRWCRAGRVADRIPAGYGLGRVCLQLVRQAGHALRLGYLKPGGQLPEVRGMVTVLAISPDTALKAYKELETKGLAAGWPGQGTFVGAALSQVALPELAGLHGPLPGEMAAADNGLYEGGMVALSTSALQDSHKRRGGSAGHGAETEDVA